MRKREREMRLGKIDGVRLYLVLGDKGFYFK